MKYHLNFFQLKYHLYSEKELASFIDYPLPSILKSNLTMDILDIMKIEYIKNFGDVRKLLSEMITPPEAKFIDSAILNLYSMEAISSKDDTGKITELGLLVGTVTTTLPLTNFTIAMGHTTNAALSTFITAGMSNVFYQDQTVTFEDPVIPSYQDTYGKTALTFAAGLSYIIF